MTEAIDHAALAESAFAEFGGLLTQERGTDLAAAWTASLESKNALSSLADELEPVIEAINANLSMTATQKAEAIRESGERYEEALQARLKKHEVNVSLIRASLETGAISDLTTPDPDNSARSLIRDEADRYIAQVTKSKLSSGGQHEQKGATMFEALLNLVRLDSKRYGPEIASTYGKSLLAAAGEGNRHASLIDLVRQSTPASTPRAQAARIALDRFQRVQLEGQTGRLALVARAKIAAALAPKPDHQANRYWYDNINNASKARR